MTDDRRTSADRARPRRRRVVDFLERNWTHLLENVVVIVGWVVLLTVVFAQTGWPEWAYSLSVVGGVVVYSLLQEPFDLPESDTDER